MNLFLNVNQLLFANAHVGHTTKFFNIKLKAYLIGIRKKLFILNVNLAILQFRIITNLIINTLHKRHKILIVKNFDHSNLHKYFLYKNIFFCDKKWIGGSLTNFKQVRLSSKFISNNNYTNGLFSLKRIPALVFFFNINLSKWALFEAYNLGIPIISLIDTDSFFSELVNYPIISNNKGIDSILLYVFTIKNSIIKAQQKEIIKILKFKRTLHKRNLRKSTIQKIYHIYSKYKFIKFSKYYKK